MSDSARSNSVTLAVTPVLPCPEDPSWVCCPNCSVPLELHQPDTEKPQRFVGICDRCGCWYLLEWIPLAAGGLMLALPNHDALQAALGAQNH
jgi:hypothetical protein